MRVFGDNFSQQKSKVKVSFCSFFIIIQSGVTKTKLKSHEVVESVYIIMLCFLKLYFTSFLIQLRIVLSTVLLAVWPKHLTPSLANSETKEITVSRMELVSVRGEYISKLAPIKSQRIPIYFTFFSVKYCLAWIANENCLMLQLHLLESSVKQKIHFFSISYSLVHT